MKWILVCCIGFAAPAFSQVQSQGVSSKVKLEETVYGHLEELNGKYKFRATEVVIAPAASSARTIMPAPACVTSRPES